MSPCAFCFGAGRVLGDICPRCQGSGKIPERPHATVRVYVAAPFSEWRLVREVQAELRRCGAVISCDWTLEADKSPGGTDASAPDTEAIRYAIADLTGVRTADAVLLLTVEDKALGCGMFVEFGFALGCAMLNDSFPGELVLGREQPRIAICGPQRNRSVFHRLARRFADWQDALPYVLGE